VGQKYWGLPTDGEIISARFEKRFLTFYEKNWAEILSDTYFKTEQFDIGHRIRPRLVYWGFLFSTDDPELLTDADFDAVSKIAVCVEIVHKASLIIDDFIDKDQKRHGKLTLYADVGAEKAIVYALNILGKALQIINQVFYAYTSSKTVYFNSMKSLMLTLQDMTLGVLKELDLEKDMYIDEEKIRGIMFLETSSLMTNSLLLGYYLANKSEKSVYEILKSIGEDFGFAFQVLNDLEPFCSSANSAHKGQRNMDFTRSRKNICIPILFSKLSSAEKHLLISAPHDKAGDIAQRLFEKYRIDTILLEEITNSFKHINYALNILKEGDASSEWVEDFRAFLLSIFEICKNRLKC
jgi:heptaprenyl diphosphate synthase